MRSERTDREWLEQELQGRAYRALLSDLQRKHPSLRRFRAWGDVLAFLRASGTAGQRADEVLRAVFQCRDEDRDPRWRAVLLAVFWPRLESIVRWKRGWDDADVLWADALYVFTRAVDRLDVSRRPARLAQKVAWDVVHALYRQCKRRWDRAKREIGVDPGELEEMGDSSAPDLDRTIDLRTARDREMERLREHVNAGRITGSDFVLLAATRLYGKPLREQATDMGISYAAARKRRWRAEAVIRRLEEAQR